MRARALPLVVASLLSLSGPAIAATYICLPIEMVEEVNRIEVLCGEPRGEGGYPRDGSSLISSFAVSKSDADFARRFEHVTQTALVSGLAVRFEYKSGDTSGQAFGCAANRCRAPVAFGLLAPSASVRIPFAVWPGGSTVKIAQGVWAYYGPFSIGEFRKLVVSMTGTGNADLYVRRDDSPTETAFTCRPLLSSSNESCTMVVNTGETGTFYVGVRGSGTGNAFKLSVSIEPK